MEHHRTSSILRFSRTVLTVGVILVGSNWVRTAVEADAWSAMSEADSAKTPELRFVMEIQHPDDQMPLHGLEASATNPNRSCSRSLQPATRPDGEAPEALPESQEIMPAPLPVPHPRTPIFDI